MHTTLCTHLEVLERVALEFDLSDHADHASKWQHRVRVDAKHVDLVLCAASARVNVSGALAHRRRGQTEPAHK